MKKFILASMVLVSLAIPAMAESGSKHVSSDTAGASKGPSKPKGCPKGFVSMGVIAKIEKDSKGYVVESIRTKGGTIEKMPAFKADNSYDSKVGDAYCADTTPDND